MLPAPNHSPETLRHLRDIARTPVGRPKMGRRGMRLALLGVALAVAVPTAAFAALDPDGPSTEFTGCLKSTGTVYQVAQGPAPKSACGSGEVEVHMKSGDITAVVAGTGLAGGASNGPAALSIDPAYRLPQGCANGQVAKWNSSSWGCFNDSDTNTTYAASTGLSLSGTSFAVRPSFRLPQNCAPGQYVKWIDGTSLFGCTWLPTDAGEAIFNFGPYSVTYSGAGNPCSGTANTPIPVSGNSYTTSSFVLPAGKWRPVTTGDTRWSIYKAKDLSTYDHTYQGNVTIQVLDANNATASKWVRNDQTNGLGDGTHADQDFSPFTSTGGSYKIQVSVGSIGCTSVQALDIQLQFERVD